MYKIEVIYDYLELSRLDYQKLKLDGNEKVSPQFCDELCPKKGISVISGIFCGKAESSNIPTAKQASSWYHITFEASVFQQMQALFLEAHIVLINSGDDFPITETQHVMGTRRPWFQHMTTWMEWNFKNDSMMLCL